MSHQLTAIERQRKIVEILSLLHEGGKFEEAKKMFDESFDGVDVTEITAAERELIKSGLNPIEIQNLCNVHSAVFKGSITDIHRSNYEHEQPGHPVHTLKLENRVITSLINDELRELEKKISSRRLGSSRKISQRSSRFTSNSKTLSPQRNADFFLHGKIWHYRTAKSNVGCG